MSEEHEDGDLSPAVQSFVSLHEMMLSMEAAGWNHDDAVRYVAIWSAEVGKGAPPDAGP